MIGRGRDVLSGAIALVLAAVTATAGPERFKKELRWIPGEVDAVLGFERPRYGDPSLSRLREELLFGTRLDQELPGLASAADAPSVDRVVLAALRLRGGERAALALLTGRFDENAAASSLLPAEAASRRHLGREMRVAPPDAATQRVRAAAFLDEETLAYGDVGAVERSIELHRAGGEGGAPANPALRSLLEEADGGSHAWGILLPAWLGFKAPGDDPALPSPGVARSLAAIQWVTLSAKVSSGVELHISTRTQTDDEARVLADALRAFLASFRLNPDAAHDVRQALQVSSVGADDATVSLSLPLSASALGRIRRNEASRRLLTWRLGSEERERRERVGEVLRLLGLGPGSRVADVGSGPGFYTVALARAVGETGHVFAVDIDEAVLGELRRRASDGRLPQIEAVLGAPDDPRLAPGSLDAALIVNSYHEMPYHRSILDRLRAALRPGGRLMLIEPYSEERRREPREDQVKRHQIAPDLVEAELREAGFQIVQRTDLFVQNPEGGGPESLVLAARPAGAACAAPKAEP
jgi:predicted methyltransferase